MSHTPNFGSIIAATLTDFSTYKCDNFIQIKSTTLLFFCNQIHLYTHLDTCCRFLSFEKHSAANHLEAIRCNPSSLLHIEWFVPCLQTMFYCILYFDTFSVDGNMSNFGKKISRKSRLLSIHFIARRRL